MKLSNWRPLIYTFLNNILAPDIWAVDTPVDGAISVATLPPIRNASWEFEPPYSVRAHLTQELFYAERVSNELWHSIPIARFEGIYGEVVYRLLTEAQDIDPDVISLTVSQFGRQDELPVSTEQLADGWMVTLRWMIDATVKVTRESDDPGIPITSINTELWTNNLIDPTFTDRVLDTVITSVLDT